MCFIDFFRVWDIVFGFGHFLGQGSDFCPRLEFPDLVVDEGRCLFQEVELIEVELLVDELVRLDDVYEALFCRFQPFLVQFTFDLEVRIIYFLDFVL